MDVSCYDMNERARTRERRRLMAHRATSKVCSKTRTRRDERESTANRLSGFIDANRGFGRMGLTRIAIYPSTATSRTQAKSRSTRSVGLENAGSSLTERASAPCTRPACIHVYTSDGEALSRVSRGTGHVRQYRELEESEQGQRRADKASPMALTASPQSSHVPLAIRVAVFACRVHEALADDLLSRSTGRHMR